MWIPHLIWSCAEPFVIIPSLCPYDLNNAERDIKHQTITGQIATVTVFNLITTSAPISTQSSNLIIFRLQSVYFYLLYKKHMLMVLI